MTIVGAEGRIATEALESLGGEAERYLAVVEAFRREGVEPHWRPESPRVALAAGSGGRRTAERIERRDQC